MKICLVSSRPTSRLLRLKEIIRQALKCSVNYAIINNKSSIDFSEFDYVILSAPFSVDAKILVRETVEDSKIILDLDPQFEHSPITFTPAAVISQNKRALELVRDEDSINSIIPGFVNVACYNEVGKLNSGLNVLVDFNYISAEEVKFLSSISGIKVNGFCMSEVSGLFGFEGITFHRALMGYELIDLTVLGDCNICVYTKAQNHSKDIIPDTMIDCMLMGIVPVVTNNLKEASRFVFDNQCGVNIGNDLSNFVEVMKVPKEFNNLGITYDFDNEIRLTQSIFEKLEVK